MLQTKGIKTTSRELDFPCFLQNKYFFARKAAGRRRHVPLTLMACAYASCSRDMAVHWVLSKVRLSSITLSFEVMSWNRYLHKAQREERQGESSPESVASEKQNEQCGCPLKLFPALLLPNSSISPEDIGEKRTHHKPLGSVICCLSGRMSSKGMTSV